MKRFLILITVLCFAAVPALAVDGESYGEGVTLDQAIPIDTLIENADDYVGKTVRIDGVITGVCKMRGCWMQVTDKESGNGVRIKVEDGVIVFPYDSMGHEAAAEGVFEAIKLTPEQLEKANAAAHQHEDGKTCDGEGEGEGNLAGCDAPVVNEYVYMIKGTGAVIKG